ncbi:zinc ribbon domain-containing protein [Acinetobacter sp. MD2]|uniref:zinc ribbon domain-containing protein n=1 Tax=Acinetobacter sp. MD2 TaxID=2600066 RepID=UPI002D1E819D|nr:zinc ribbon domain-containing protein [Acinetobacter sp. MD2]MEB3768014.1 zinc ribbon domain-containing protein [Acinetobacter sp. MD2]
MAYEYNSQDQRFEFPNPYKIENFFKILGAVIFMMAGMWLLFHAKSVLHNNLLAAAIPLLLGIGMLGYGGLLLAKGLANLKFYFGRNQPIGLAQEFSAQQLGSTQGAQSIKEMLRQNALSYKEPHGSVNGILYSIFPHLIFSPLFIRHAAEVQFQNAIVFIITLLSALVAKLGAAPNVAEWLGIFYNILALAILLRPMASPKNVSQDLGVSKVIILVVIAILGPVVLPFFTQNAVAPTWLPGMDKAIFTLIAALIAIGLFFLAVLAQIVKKPPQASTGMVQDSLSMNCQPAQLFDELERHLQNQWVSAIPNRIYSRLLPNLELNQERGSFEGEILEETQPVPVNTRKDMTLSSCFKEAQYRWLGVLNSFGILCFLVAVVLLGLFATSLYNGRFVDFSYFGLGFFGLSMWILGKFCFDHGNYLWSRFDFVSTLIWVEVKGNYQLSRVDFGRYLEDTIKTQKNVINVETMTLRVWYAEISTTTFGKYQQRSILNMVARKDAALELKEHLATFIQDQSMIVAPTANTDLSRIASINQINHAMQHPTQAANAAEIGITMAEATFNLNPTTTNTGTSEAQVPMFCTGCGYQLSESMLFCPKCGTKKAS